MIKKLLFACVIGLVATVYVAQNDPWTLHQVEKLFCHEFQNALDCTVSCRVTNFDFFGGTMTLEDVSVAPSLPDCGVWEWHAKHYVTGFSWVHFLLYGMLDLWVHLENFTIVTALHEGTLAIAPHIQEMMKGPNLLVASFLKKLTTHHASFAVVDAASGIDTRVFWRKSNSCRMNERFRSTCAITDGYCTHNGITDCANIKGSVSLDAFETADGSRFACTLEGRAYVPAWGDEGTCFLNGSWDKDHGRFSLHNAEQTCSLSPIILGEKNKQLWVRANGRIPIAHAMRTVMPDAYALPLSGMCAISINGTCDPPASIDAQITVEHMRYKNHEGTGFGRCTVQRRAHEWQADMLMQLHPYADVHGTASFNDTDKSGAFLLVNTAAITCPLLPHWKVQPRNCVIDGTVTDGWSVNATYRCDAVHTSLDKQMPCVGSCTVNPDTWHTVGTVHDMAYTVTGSTTTYPYVQKITAEHTKTNALSSIACADDSATHFKGSMSVPFARILVTSLCGYDVQGEGLLQYDVRYDNNLFTCSMYLKDGTIRLPQTYNFVDTFHADMTADMCKRKITVTDCACGLHTGTVRVHRAVVYFDESGHVVFAHVPAIFDHCLLNIKRDLFTMVSGALTFQKRADTMPSLTGRLTVDRAQLKENLFAESLQKKILQSTSAMIDTQGADIACDVTLETKEPIRVDTPFLKTNARMKLAIGAQVLNPTVTGSIDLNAGTLMFPHRPLYITKGTITFLPDQLHNPLVELVARNTIKSHQITLHVTGSLLDHQVFLESTPLLTEEQIVALLLVGSHDETLNTMMPTLIAQNLKNLIFGTNHSSFFERYFRPFIKQFNISLIPRFSDKTGRGGLRGAIEIDVNDRLRALIQKNFNLSEDTRVEIEYELSDEMRIRAIRDERRDLGTELEMRWKF